MVWGLNLFSYYLNNRKQLMVVQGQEKSELKLSK